MCLIQSKDLTMRRSRVSKSGNVVPLQDSALPCDLSEKHNSPMQPIVGIEIMAHVTGPLIDVHRCGGRATETRGANVGTGNERQQFDDGRIGRSGPLQVG